MNAMKKSNSKRSQQSQKRVGRAARNRTSWTKEKCVQGWRKIKNKKEDNEEAVLMEWISIDFCFASYDLRVNRSHRLALCLSKQSTRCDSGLKKETTAQNKSSIILNKTISQIFYYDLLFLFYYFIIIPFIIFVVYYCSNIFVSLYIAARHW